MKTTTQGWGWLTAGVLALGLNGIYHDGGARWTHRMLGEAACRAEAVLAPLSGQVNEFLSKLEVVSAPRKVQSCRRVTTLAPFQTTLVQGEMARIAAMSAREEAQLARLEANRARMEAQAVRAQFATISLKPMEFSAAPDVRVHCPRVRFVIPQLPFMMEPRSVNLGAPGPI